MQTRLLSRLAYLQPARVSFARTLATSVPGHLTILQAIKNDHREIEAFYEQYLANDGNLNAQQRWANQLTWEIARHSIGEELVVYPMLETALGDKGHAFAEHDRADHQFVKDRLKEIEYLEVGTSEYDSVLKAVMDQLKEHIHTEETQDFPLLEAAIGHEKSMKTAKSFNRTKQFVPTRPHPHAPNRPPFETLAGLLAAPMDKLKDAFAEFPNKDEVESVSNAATTKH